MSARVQWDNRQPTTMPRTIGKLPKKPVVWMGAVWLQMPDGEMDTRSWRSNGPITTKPGATGASPAIGSAHRRARQRLGNVVGVLLQVSLNSFIGCLAGHTPYSCLVIESCQL